jgi:GGDEF domain-containing protein
LEAHLAGLAGDNAALLTGTLQHVGLDEVRDALGHAWPALAPQLLSFAATRLQLWTGLHDEVRRHGGAGFVIRFAHLPQPAADQQAKRLALRLKAELLEQFPQVADGKQRPHVGAAGPAHEVMARRLEASEQYRRSVQRHDGADPRLWRSALGQAVVELLEADGELSAEALITQLQLQSQEGDDLVLRTASIDAAIERLRLLVARVKAAEATSETTAGSGIDAA